MMAINVYKDGNNLSSLVLVLSGNRVCVWITSGTSVHTLKIFFLCLGCSGTLFLSLVKQEPPCCR